MIKSFNM